MGSIQLPISVGYRAIGGATCSVSGRSKRWLHRKYFELALLAQVKDELKSGDLFIPHGERYDDYREQLVDEAIFAEELPAYGEVTGLATDAGIFIRGLRDELTALADTVGRRFPENVHAEVVDGRLVLKRLRRTEV